MQIRKVWPIALVILAIAGCLWAAISPVEPAYSLESRWAVNEYGHQPEAKSVFHRAGFVYTGGGAPEGRIAKVDLTTGKVAWTSPTGNSYQPSNPVSNGEVVVFGTYYTHSFVGLDDRTGEPRWKISNLDQNMSAACFADDLVFIGSYDRNLYAITWADGQVKWKTSLGNLIWSQPCIYEKWVIIGCVDGNLYFVDRQTGRIEQAIACGGKVEGNPLVVHERLFVLADAQKYDEPYQTDKTEKTMLVVDLRQRKVISSFRAEGHFSHHVIASEDQVYFADDYTLYAYDAKQTRLAWQRKVPFELNPYPLLTPTRVILAMNRAGMHGEHATKLLVLDRQTGNELRSQETGGIPMRKAQYVQSGDEVVTVEYRLAGWRLQSAP
ncbi:MAG TPA: PQQ-binding-like beta-propeller repeat protein [Chthoniobacteraceae bacterium]|nr:PQQ-binding-like beta-propeller repeat protein [Chthoniobacteraceae bacterium]